MNKSNNNEIKKHIILFKNNPNIKYKFDITQVETSIGLEIFEVFTSYIDNNLYLASQDFKLFNINIISLINNKKILFLKGHQTSISTIRYFNNNKNNSEYLISADKNKKVIIWEINKNYNIKYQINTKFKGRIYSCLLIFPHNINDNLIIVSSSGPDTPRIYNFDNGKMIKGINNKSSIYCLLSWYNSKKNEYYIIQISYAAIRISNLKDKEYAVLSQKPEDIHYSGFIFNKDDNDYLCCSSNNGYINIWDLYNKKIFKTIIINKSRLMKIIQWNKKYFIVSDLENKSIKIIDYEQNKVISDIKMNNCKVQDFRKIFHPVYRESLLISTSDNKIKLWCL